MNTTQPAAPPTSPAVSRPISAAYAPPEPVIASDFDTFLQMLTTQARYQDPLEPLDSSEYAAQLAQFSMVEQQVQSNTALAAIAGSLAAADLAKFSGWVGMDARSVSAVFFDGAPVSVTPAFAPEADRAVMVVRDSADQVVQRVPVPVLEQTLQWDGIRDDGNPFAPGSYRFEIESYKGTDLLSTVDAEAYGRISEARVENGSVVLILEGGEAIQAGQVTGLRQGR